MKITHIYHDGFLAEMEHSVLVFDWYTGELPEFAPDKTIYVFVSHQHRDHFGNCIFRLAEKYADVVYVLSCDIPSGLIPAAVRKCMIPVLADRHYSVRQAEIDTLLSTDLGVAFYIEIEGHTVYHAGDLNLWYWEGEPAKDNDWQVRIYHQEIDRLAEIIAERKRKHSPEGSIADLPAVSAEIAFLPLDSRLESHGADGFVYFMEKIGAENVFPMHYWDNVAASRAYLAEKRMLPFVPLIHYEDETVLQEPERGGRKNET